MSMTKLVSLFYKAYLILIKWQNTDPILELKQNTDCIPMLAHVTEFAEVVAAWAGLKLSVTGAHPAPEVASLRCPFIQIYCIFGYTYTNILNIYECVNYDFPVVSTWVKTNIC